MSEKSASPARREPRQGRSRATVLAIRQAAARVLATEGHERATTNRIAAVAGVSIGTLYQYFEDREAVFDALTEDVLEQLVTAVGSSIPGAPTAPLDDQLRALTSAVLRVLSVHPGVLRQLDAIPGSSYRARLQGAKDRVRAAVEALLATHPDVAPGLDPRLASRLFTDIGEGVAYNLQPGDDVEALASEVTRMLALWLRDRPTTGS